MAGEERGKSDPRVLKPAKHLPALREAPQPPELDLEKEERHKLDERA
ncbi:MAG TPA: hypothetical protein VMI32_08425 [Candidatus Solibacter sp.]|nr:hypothetical protein [Candidatus Solibacter sp.]